MRFKPILMQGSICPSESTVKNLIVMAALAIGCLTAFQSNANAGNFVGPMTGSTGLKYWTHTDHPEFVYLDKCGWVKWGSDALVAIYGSGKVLIKTGWQTDAHGKSVYLDPKNPNNIYMNSKWTSISTVISSGASGNIVGVGAGGNIVGVGAGGYLLNRQVKSTNDASWANAKRY